MMDLGAFTWDGMLESLARKAGDRKVESLTTKALVTVHEDDPLMECRVRWQFRPPEVQL
ncbi:MAG: hypothetical protein V1766_15835 [Pseudomonadota bacterium]